MPNMLRGGGGKRCLHMNRAQHTMYHKRLVSIASRIAQGREGLPAGTQLGSTEQTTIKT
jgi:hypothetical protein